MHLVPIPLPLAGTSSTRSGCPKPQLGLERFQMSYYEKLSGAPFRPKGSWPIRAWYSLWDTGKNILGWYKTGLLIGLLGEGPVVGKEGIEGGWRGISVGK